MKIEKFYRLVVALVIAATYGCGTSISTPEKTIDQFIKGYRRGDASLVLSTMHEPKAPAPLKSGRDETYLILEKLLVLESGDSTSRQGDIHVRVLRQIKLSTGPVQLIAYFRLREIKGEWKIVGYAADTGGEGP